MSPLPRLPERWLRSALGDSPSADAIVGDLREDFLQRTPHWRRDIAYTLACLGVTARYAPGRWLDATRVELSQAVVRLRRAPLYSLSVISTLAIGIGVAATLFTVVYGALLRPLPYPEAHMLIRWGQSPREGSASGSVNSAAPANFLDLARDAADVAALGAYQLARFTTLTPAGAQRVLSARVSGTFFDVLGARAMAGRLIGPADDVPSAGPVVVIGESLWRRDFAADATIVGRQIAVDTVPHTVVGVLPARYPWPGDPQLWVPFQWDVSAASIRNRRAIEGIGRLRDGRTVEQATEALRARFSALSVSYPDANGASTIGTLPLTDWLLERQGPNSSLLPLVAGLGGVMLALMWLNVGTLVMARRDSQAPDAALRQVLGASPARQWLTRATEASLLTTAGAAGGLLLTAWAVPTVVRQYGASIPRASTLAVDTATLVIVLMAAIVSMATITRTLRLRGRPTPVALTTRSVVPGGRLRRPLVALQIGLAGGLTYGAVLVGGLLSALAQVDLGVPIDHALTTVVGIPVERYSNPGAVGRFFRELESAAATIPGVEAAGVISRTPFAGGTNGDVSNADAPDRTLPVVEWRSASSGYFSAIGLPVLAGQTFEQGPAVGRRVVVSQSLAEALFGPGDAVGGRLRLDTGAPYAVIGVVGDIRDFGPTRAGRPTLYVEHGSEAGFAAMSEMTLVMRTAGDPYATLAPLRSRLSAIDSEVPLRASATLAELAERARGVNRAMASRLLTALASLALCLGAVGLYGVAAHGVVARTREFGIRLALGETPEGLARLCLADGARLVTTGAVVSVATGVAIHRLVATTLVADFQPPSAVVITIVALVLLATLGLAYALPVARAARLSPLEAMRVE